MVNQFSYRQRDTLLRKLLTLNFLFLTASRTANKKTPSTRQGGKSLCDFFFLPPTLIGIPFFPRQTRDPLAAPPIFSSPPPLPPPWLGFSPPPASVCVQFFERALPPSLCPRGNSNACRGGSADEKEKGFPSLVCKLALLGINSLAILQLFSNVLTYVGWRLMTKKWFPCFLETVLSCSRKIMS